MEVLVVVANYQALEGNGDAIACVLREHVAATRAEPGCIQFVVNRSIEDPDSFVLYEEYRGEDAFEAHRRTPHFRRYIEQDVAPLLKQRTWGLFRRVEPGG